MIFIPDDEDTVEDVDDVIIAFVAPVIEILPFNADNNAVPPLTTLTPRLPSILTRPVVDCTTASTPDDNIVPPPFFATIDIDDPDCIDVPDDDDNLMIPDPPFALIVILPVDDDSDTSDTPDTVDAKFEDDIVTSDDDDDNNAEPVNEDIDKVPVVADGEVVDIYTLLPDEDKYDPCDDSDNGPPDDDTTVFNPPSI
jgi:hypothetical protein